MFLDELCALYVRENPLVKSRETERLLGGAVRQYSKFLGRRAELADLNAKTLTAFIRHRRQAGRAESTLEREASKLMTLWRWAALNGMTQPPRIRIEKAQVDTPVAFLRCEVRRLFYAALQYDRQIGGVSGNVFMPALLSTIWDTAERIGAIRQIDRVDFDVGSRWRRGWVTLRHRKRSGRTLVRPLRRTTASYVRALLGATDARQPFAVVDRTTLYAHLERLLTAAGLPTDRKHKFHCVRRSHASYLHRAGGDAQESLDHADPAILNRNYLDPRVAKKKHAVDVLFDPLSLWNRLLARFRL